MTDRPRLLLLDGHSLAYRAYYALPVENFTTTSGQSTNVVYGFANMLANALRDERPTHAAVAFDVSRSTFRTEAFPEYKATRSRSPEGFGGQLRILDELLAAMSVPVLRAPGYEADDVIASLTARAGAEGLDVLIITGDRDVLQLVGDDVTVLYFYRTASEMIRYTPETVREKYGLSPAQYPDFAALRGDPSDNLPGIPGIGEKTAAKWVREFGSLDALLDRAGEVKGKAGERLRAALDTVRLNRRLTELVRDLDLPVEIGDLRRRPYDVAAFTSLLDELEFRNPSLRQRLFAADPGGGRPPETTPAAAERERIEGRELDAGELAGWLRTRATGLTGLAAEYTWARGEGGVTRIALATGDGHAASFEPPALTAADERAFADWLADPARPKALHDVKSLLRVFGEHGIGEHGPIAGIAADTAMAAYLLLPGLAAYGIADLAGRHLGRRPPEGGPAGLMLSARAVLDLAGVFAADLASTGMDTVLREVELPLSDLLARAERAGVHVDAGLLEELEGRFAAAMERAADEAAEIAGRRFNPGSTKQLQEVLFGELGLPKTKKIKSGYSTDLDALTWLAAQTDNGLPQVLLRHRDQARLRTTVTGLIREIGADGRIHTTFRQTVAATGRLTSTDPNLQVIPIRTGEGRSIRRAFRPGPGYESLMTADYGQLELRVMAHLSQDPTLLAAFESGEDLHTTMAAQVFRVSQDAVTPEMRRKIKAMSYGLAYGLSAFGLAKQLGIPVAEARPLMDAYFERLGGVRDYLDHVVAEARVTGYTRTVLGRRRHLPQLASDDRRRRETAERMALNAPVQGSAADIVKIAMLRVDGALTAAGLRSRLLLQVHDEIVLEVAPGERDAVEEIVRTGMTTAYPLSVGLEVAVGTGPDWDAAAH
ncbi:DNA polymerase I [Actinomadura livida]|uniref:DNA polymerase I n=1 Tax=Actinomadura livida TaxID=79909 RepID=A0A7W7ICL3_9ACTN|nr:MULTISPECIES: DNA polymerase I [Actinomadura]MBB4774624.1 DNA polymerase-1 [Actinomadura catellatispora]GGU07101.1 DNA polymerase (POL I) [Actinomadura livida]